jgi:hypothetical protein
VNPRKRGGVCTVLRPGRCKEWRRRPDPGQVQIASCADHGINSDMKLRTRRALFRI